jgi:hypothetical protein
VRKEQREGWRGKRGGGDKHRAKTRMPPVEIRTGGKCQDKETEEEKEEQFSPRTYAQK